jgi:hypothetical protein
MANQICTLMLLLLATGLYGQSKKAALAALQAKKDSLINIMMLENEQASRDKEKKQREIAVINNDISGQQAMLKNLKTEYRSLQQKLQQKLDSTEQFMFDAHAVEIINEYKLNDQDFFDNGYQDYLESIVIASGRFSPDNQPDYFYTYLFNEEQIKNKHYFYTAEKNQVTELRLESTVELLRNFEVYRMEKGVLYGAAVLQLPNSNQIKKVDAAFSIRENQLLINSRFLPAIRQANDALMQNFRC